MPHPREAIYDVLASKQRRKEVSERARTLEEEWARYEQENERSNIAYGRQPAPVKRKQWL